MANTDDVKALVQDMANAHKDRVKHVKGIKNETKKFIGTCKEEDKARAADVSKLKNETKKFIGTCKEEDKARAADVSKNETKKFIGTCKEEDKARAADVSKLKNETKKFIGECMKEDKARAADVDKLKADVDSLVDEFGKEHAATASAWKGLLSTMAGTRQGKPSSMAKAAAKREPVGAGTGKKGPAKRGGKKRRR